MSGYAACHVYRTNLGLEAEHTRHDHYMEPAKVIFQDGNHHVPAIFCHIHPEPVQRIENHIDLDLFRTVLADRLPYYNLGSGISAVPTPVYFEYSFVASIFQDLRIVNKSSVSCQRITYAFSALLLQCLVPELELHSTQQRRGIEQTRMLA